MNENDMSTMEESVREPMAPKMEDKEASTQPSGRKSDYDLALDAAGSYEEPEIEGTFTMTDGVVTEEEVVNKKNRMLLDEERQARDEDDGRDVRVIGVTDSNKEIQVAKDTVHAGYVIEFSTGGQLPADLQGRWTTFEKAAEAVRLYLAKREQQKEG